MDYTFGLHKIPEIKFIGVAAIEFLAFLPLAILDRSWGLIIIQIFIRPISLLIVLAIGFALLISNRKTMRPPRMLVFVLLVLFVPVVSWVGLFGVAVSIGIKGGGFPM